MENKKAPAFKLEDQDKKTHSLADYKGKWLLIYFYPRDLTSGCTVEAEGFRDSLKALQKLGVAILGVSCDDVKSHRKFADKLNLTFPLLADVDKKMVQAYGVWLEKSMYGKKYMGIQRDSFLIEPSGKIVKHYKKVKPKEHPDQVIEDVKKLV